MRTRILLALAGLIAGLITPAFTQDEVTPQIRQQIDALNQKFDEAINNHDPAGWRIKWIHSCDFRSGFSLRVLNLFFFCFCQTTTI